MIQSLPSGSRQYVSNHLTTDIIKQGRAHARSMLVEAAWVISGVAGPLRAFFIRVRDKRGKHVAAVATAA